MTSSLATLGALLPLVDDLARDLPEAKRYERLLAAIRLIVPCDASAILRVEGENLVPLATDGLSDDVMGRRFRIADHPRFKELLEHDGPKLFAADSPLPDPYDGMIAGNLPLDFHDCMGCPLLVNDQCWGLITLDAVDVGRFGNADLAKLQAFASLAAATVSAAERLKLLERVAEQERRRAEGYRRAVLEKTATRRLTGRSDAYRRLMDEVNAVAESDLTVLITGDTGVGKELVAVAIHDASLRADRPMISINCAALPANLLESELFGHVRGAFSGATADRRGKFELAHQGTLFLDEVADLSLAAQASLLRVMQTGQLQRVGSDREHRVDVRIIAATNRDLADEVARGRCREDFYHRLAVFPIKVPSLRDRTTDVLLLSGTFVEEIRARLGLAGLRLASDAQAALLAYEWPGNVRELEHVLSRSALKALVGRASTVRSLTLSASDLALPSSASATSSKQNESNNPVAEAPFSLRRSMEAHERALIENALLRHQGNWAAAARSLGVDRTNLRRAASRLGLR